MLTVPRLYSQRAVYHVENWIIRLTVLFVIISPSIRLDLPGVGGNSQSDPHRFLQLELRLDVVPVECYLSNF